MIEIDWVKDVAIPWMRANVRCETCKHYEMSCELHEEGTGSVGFCDQGMVADDIGRCFSDDSCATHWEPKEER